MQFLDGTEISGAAECLRPWIGDGRFPWAFDNCEDRLQIGRLLDDPYFESFVRDELKTIRKKDGIVITSTQSPADALDSKIASALLEQTPTTEVRQLAP